MAGRICHILASVAVLVHLFQWTLGYSFRNCIEVPESNHTSFRCIKRESWTISAIVEDVRPSATTLIISHNNITNIPQRSFSNLPNLKNLSLDCNHVKYINKDAFLNLAWLETLNLSCNDISNLSPSVFNGTINLTELILSDNNLTNLSPYLFSGLYNMKFLILRNNHLSNFSDVVQSVTHLTRLRKLDLCINNLTSLQHSANLPLSLSILYLCRNRLATLACGSTFLSRVNVLDLSNNSQLLSMAFQGLDLSRLTNLSLRFTNVRAQELLKVSNVTPGNVDFSGMGLKTPSLLVKLCKLLSHHGETHTVQNDMILQNNGIQKLFISTFSECPPIKGFLDLSHNNLNNCSCQCLRFLKGQDQLKSFSAEHNHLTKLISCNREENVSFPRLTELSYRYNRILRVYAFAFHHTPILRTLKLNINTIAYMDRNALSGLGNLTILRLDNNLLSDLYEESFKDLYSLEQLILRNNQIAVIFNRTFYSLGRLNILDLGGNKISQFQSEAFVGLKNLTKLYLDRNHLTKIDSQLFGKLQATLQVLDLQSNQIRFFSDETFSPFVNLTKLLDLKLDAQTPFGITVLPHAFFRGLSSLTSLYLTNNRISSFGTDTFDDLTSLKFLSLDDSGIGVTQLQPGIFKNLRKLTILEAENMGIRSFSREVFGNLTGLQRLNFNRNAMQTLDMTALEELSNLTYLDIRNSPLSCTCPNSDLQNWTKKNQRVQLVYLYNLKCPDLQKKQFYSFDTKVCYLDLGVYLFTSTCSVVFLLTIIPLLYVKLYWKFKFSYYVFRSWFGEQWRRLREEEEECKYDAFISYNSADEKWVLEQLLPNLEGNGSSFRLCLHHRDFELGRDIVDNIVAAVYSSRKTVCVVSQHFLRSEWCSLEIQLASYRLFHELRDVLLLVFLEPIPERQLSVYHRMRKIMLKKTYLQWPGSDCADPAQAQELFWNQLKRALKSSNSRCQDEDEAEEEQVYCKEEGRDTVDREYFVNQSQTDDESYYLMP